MDFKYPYTDFHELNLDWFLAEFKKLTADWLQVQHDWEDEQQAFQDLHDYVQDYFANLNLYQEVRDILWSPEMQGNIQIILSNLTTNMLPGVVADQITNVVATQLSTVVALQLPAVVEAKLPAALPAAVAGEAADWLAAHVDPDTGYVIDNTLTISQAAADAAVTGSKIKANTNAMFADIPENTLSSDWQQGNMHVANPTTLLTATNRITTTYRKPIDIGYKLFTYVPSGWKIRILFFTVAGAITTDLGYTVAMGDYDDLTTWHTDDRVLTMPSGAVAWAACLAKVDDSDITPADLPGSLYLGYISIDRRIDENADNIKTIKNDLSIIPVSSYSGTTISILGDSISTFAGNNATPAGDGHLLADGTYTYAGNHCRYPTTYLTNVDETYWKKLIDFYGMTLGVNDSWAGSTVSWNGTESGEQGANKYIASPTRIGHLDNNGEPDIILVNAGTNDIGMNVTIGTFNTESPKNYTDAQIAALPVATFADAYRAMLIRLQKSYPLARIIVMLPNYTTSYYDPEKADAYLEVIKEECDYFGVPWIDMRASGINIWNTSAYTGDGIHPNPGGMQLLFEKIVKFFQYEMGI